MSLEKTSKGLLAILSRRAFAVADSPGVPPKDVIAEAESLETDAGNVALLAEGLVKAGDDTVEDSSSTSLRGYIFAREEGKCVNPDSCDEKGDCCKNYGCKRGKCVFPCVNPTTSYSCTNNSQCCENSRCEKYGLCVPGLQCSPIGGKCKSHYDCCKLRGCQEGVCVDGMA